MSKVRIKEAEVFGDERKKYVTKMFDSVAKNYDFLNHLLSGGIDILWRKRAVRQLSLTENEKHLDLACGTGDFAIEVQKKFSCHVTGADISTEMLAIAREKTKEKMANFEFLHADAENLPFEDNTFSSVTIGFGIRNFGDKAKALREILRILKPQGKLVILEFSKIRTPIIGALFDFYFRNILPKIGALFSDDKYAYTYLPDSVNTFPNQPDFTKLMTDQGFQNAYYKNYTFGIATLFYAEK
jgi:demethylmenaquinone methyltransferase/2-methoxy-6-polyprenyl-1,4-benzoquinol methylase